MISACLSPQLTEDIRVGGGLEAGPALVVVVVVVVPGELLAATCPVDDWQPRTMEENIYYG